jgi:hypothetical protein
MSDHLDFIQIHGLVSSETEVLQGAVAGGLSLNGEEGGSLNLDVGPLNETLQQALLYTDDEGNSRSYLANISPADLSPLTTLLQQALLSGEEGTSVFDKIAEKIADLSLVDEIIDFGFCRVHLKGKIIEY